MKKTFLYTALVAASLLGAGTANAGTLSPPGTTTAGVAVLSKSSISQADINALTPNPVTLELAGQYNGNPDQWEYTLPLDGNDQEIPLVYTFGSGPEQDEVSVTSLTSVFDPVGSFAASFKDRGAASDFYTSFLLEIDPNTTNMVRMSGSAGLTMTDGGAAPSNGTLGVGAGLVDPSYVILYTVLDASDTAVASFGLINGQTFTGVTPPNTTRTVSGFQDWFNIDCGSIGCSNVLVEIGFRGTGGSDVYGFSGGWVIEQLDIPNAVPEPSSTLGLVGMGILGAIWIGRRQRS